MAKVTPMMQQYFSLKNKYPDSILFFRLGDFYEMFGDDAEEVVQILDIALTSRNKGGGEKNANGRSTCPFSCSIYCKIN